MLRKKMKTDFFTEEEFCADDHKAIKMQIKGNQKKNISDRTLYFKSLDTLVLALKERKLL